MLEDDVLWAKIYKQPPSWRFGFVQPVNWPDVEWKHLARLYNELNLKRNENVLKILELN